MVLLKTVQDKMKCIEKAKRTGDNQKYLFLDIDGMDSSKTKVNRNLVYVEMPHRVRSHEARKRAKNCSVTRKRKHTSRPSVCSTVRRTK